MTTDKNYQKKFDDFQQACVEAGIKLTHQRIEIFKIMMATKDHLSAEDVYDILKPTMPTIALDTIYRTLSTFVELGIVTRLKIIDDRIRFDPNLKKHCHFICNQCKIIKDFYWPEFEDWAIPLDIKKIGDVESRYLELRGLCLNCKKI
jgi:Fur family peroxide stress response transcriptional regulator